VFTRISILTASRPSTCIYSERDGAIAPVFRALCC